MNCCYFRISEAAREYSCELKFRIDHLCLRNQIPMFGGQSHFLEQFDQRADCRSVQGIQEQRPPKLNESRVFLFQSVEAFSEPQRIITVTRIELQKAFGRGLRRFIV